MDESPESLLQSLRNPRTLPFVAIKAATSDRARVAPLLILELQKFAADFQSYDRNDIVPVTAIYLLAQWEAAESFETVLDCFALDDKYGGYELGDLITENGPVILAAFERERRKRCCFFREIRCNVEGDNRTIGRVTGGYEWLATITSVARWGIIIVAVHANRECNPVG